MKIDRVPLAEYARRFRENTPTSLARYGDGEWLCIMGAQGVNCDHHQYFPALREDLRRAVASQFPYWRGIGGVGLHRYGGGIRDYITHYGLQDQPWVAVDTFLQASRTGKLYPLVEALREQSILYVGPPHTRLIHDRIFPLVEHIAIPERDCYTKREDIRYQIDQTLRTTPGITMVGFSASMLSNVLIDDLYPEYGWHISLIDFGSLWDVYCGVRSRSYAFDKNWPALIKKNLGRA